MWQCAAAVPGQRSLTGEMNSGRAERHHHHHRDRAPQPTPRRAFMGGRRRGSSAATVLVLWSARGRWQLGGRRGAPYQYKPWAPSMIQHIDAAASQRGGNELKLMMDGVVAHWRWQIRAGPDDSHRTPPLRSASSLYPLHHLLPLAFLAAASGYSPPAGCGSGTPVCSLGEVLLNGQHQARHPSLPLMASGLHHKRTTEERTMTGM